MKRRWQRLLVLSSLVVLATMGWVPLACAALVIDGTTLRQPEAGAAGALAPVACPDGPPRWCFDSEPGPRPPWDRLLPQDRATAPSAPSSGFSGDIASAVGVTLWLPPPPLVACIMTRAGLAWPDPAPFRLLRPPRCALVLV